jgi:hypothetical protein
MVIDKKGILITGLDGFLYIKFLFAHNRFNSYKFNLDSIFSRTLGSTFLLKIFKSVKKTDSIDLDIYQDFPNNLYITINKASDNPSKHTIVMKDFLQLKYDFPSIKDLQPTTMISKDVFNNFIKSISTLSTLIEVKTQENSILFNLGDASVCNSSFEFGEKWSDTVPIISILKYSRQTMTKIKKFTSLSQNFNIYTLYKEEPDYTINSIILSGDLGTPSSLGSYWILIPNEPELTK